jgi:hypothetical protein
MNKRNEYRILVGTPWWKSNFRTEKNVKCNMTIELTERALGLKMVGSGSYWFLMTGFVLAVLSFVFLLSYIKVSDS